MRRGYAKIYFIVLILLVSFSFFFNFDGLKDITGRITREELCTDDICDTDLYVGGEILEDARANVCKEEGIVGVRERISEFPREYYPDTYGGLENSNGEYHFTLYDGRDAMVYFAFTEDRRRKCSDENIIEEPSVSKEGTFTVSNPCMGLPEDECGLTEGCVVDYREQGQSGGIGNCFGKQTQIVPVCLDGGEECVPILPTTPEKTLTFVDEKDVPIEVTVTKTNSGFSFRRSSGGEYSTNTLATGEYCTVVGVNFLTGIENYNYQMQIESCSGEGENRICTYVPNDLTWNLVDTEGEYVYNQALSGENQEENCPPLLPATFSCPEEGCPNPYPGLCNIWALPVQIPVLIGAYCDGWDARELATGANAQQEVADCDQRVRDAIEGSGECNNNPPTVSSSGKSTPNFKEGDKCELMWAVNDIEDSSNQKETDLFVPRIIDEPSINDLFSKNPPYEQIMPYVIYDKEGKLYSQGTNLFRRVVGRAIDSGTDQDGKLCQEKGEAETSKEIIIPTVEFRGKKAVQLPTLKFEITKTTYKDSCDPKGILDAGFVIETTIERWLILEDCQIAGKTTLNFKYRNMFLGSPSNYSVRTGLFEAVEKALEGGISEANLEKVKGFIFRYYTPPPHKEWQYAPLIVESVDGKVYLSTIDHEMTEGLALLPNKQKDLLLTPPGSLNFKSIENDEGEEALRSIEINVEEGANGAAKRCFNNLKEDDQDGGFWGKRSIRQENQAKKFAEIEAFYTGYIKGHYDKLGEYFENARSCLCKE
ncbi:MAG: hypothetical protein ABIB47_04980 [Candidatus Woesearchaeota archaeon]